MKYAYQILSPDDLLGEKWLPLPGYGLRYSVSNFGRIKSLYRANSSGGGIVKRKTPLIRRQRINHDGYLQVGLQNGKGLKTLIVHRAVAKLFVSNPNNLPEVNHLNGKLDNMYISLEWSSSSDNQKHAYKHSLKTPLAGVLNPRCKLSVAKVLYIFNSPKKCPALAKELKVSAHTIKHIKRGSTWSHVTGKKYVIKNAKPPRNNNPL